MSNKSFDTSDSALLPFALYHGEILETKRGNAKVVGVRDEMLWLQFDDSPDPEPIKKAKGWTALSTAGIRRKKRKAVEMGILLGDADFTDVVIHVDDKEIKAHKCVLAARSPYFRKMFLSQMKEASGNIEIKTSSFVSISRVIEFMYSNHLSFSLVSPEEYIEIIHLSMMYDINDLQKLCANSLNKYGEPEDFLLILEHGENFEFLKGALLLQIRKLWNSLIEEEKFYEILSRNKSLWQDIFKSADIGQPKKIVVRADDQHRIREHFNNIASEDKKLLDIIAQTNFSDPKAIISFCDTHGVVLPMWFSERYKK